MFTDDDLDPKTRKAKPRVLDSLSIDDLREYVKQLQAEILRVEAEISKKEKHKAAMDALFKSS